MRKIIVSILSLVLFTSNVAVVSAKAQRDWSAVKSLPAQKMFAIETKDGVTTFGIVVSSDDSGITIYLANVEGIESQETPFQRGEIKKVWRAKLGSEKTIC